MVEFIKLERKKRRMKERKGEMKRRKNVVANVATTQKGEKKGRIGMLTMVLPLFRSFDPERT